MRMLGLGVMAFVAVGSWLGCGGGGAAAGGEQLDAALKQLETFKTEMCACKTKECATKVDDAIGAWRSKSKAELDKAVASVEKLQDFQKKSASIDEGTRECHRARTDKLAAAIARIEKFANEACECKDKACANDVEKDYEAWKDRTQKTFTEEDLKGITKEMDEKFDRFEDQLKSCIEKHAAGGSGELAVTSLSPESGDANGGTYVVIKGRGFTKPARMAKIYFGSGSAARQGQVVRFQSDGELIVMAPGGTAGEIVDVLITFEPGGVMKLPQAFKFVDKDPGATVDDLVKP